MAELPYMPMYWDAYLGDTRHLTTVEHGAYLLLLGAMWRSGGTLPLDDKFIARTVGLTPGQWRRVQPTIMRFMTTIAGGRFTQAKLLETFDAVRQKRQSKSSNARSMWLKRKGRPDAFALRPLSEPHAYQSQIENNRPIQSTTQAQEESGSAEKQAEVAAPPASPSGKEDSIPISSYLLSTKLLKRRA